MVISHVLAAVIAATTFLFRRFEKRRPRREPALGLGIRQAPLTVTTYVGVEPARQRANPSPPVGNVCGLGSAMHCASSYALPRGSLEASAEIDRRIYQLKVLEMLREQLPISRDAVAAAVAR